MSSEKNRRFFIRQMLATASGLAAFSAGLSSCSTLDDYLFEDYYDLKDQVLIIGGGLSGLYLAYKLKQNKVEFRLFEASSQFGGRIRSSQNFDFGASVYSADDVLLNQLMKELSLVPEKLDRKNLYLAQGLQTLISTLVERISGLMAYRNLRLRWRLISIQKIKSSFELVFETPKGRRTFVSKRVALALPPKQWGSISGLLDLDEMAAARGWLKSLKIENVMKIAFNTPPPPSAAKNILTYEDDFFSARQVNKHFKNQNWTEIDFKLHGDSSSIEIEKLNEFIRKRMNLTAHFNRLSTENYYDWARASFIQAAYFKNALAWPQLKDSRFFILGDYATSHKPSTLEGALNSAQSASDLIL